MTKKATRFKIEVVNADGCVQWEVLGTDFPPEPLWDALRAQGFRVRRANSPTATSKYKVVFSTLDPENSVRAAQEAEARRSTMCGNVLLMLLSNPGRWFSRDQVRRVGGDQGDRRFREIRDADWPVEIRQTTPERPWDVRIRPDFMRPQVPASLPFGEPAP